MKICQACGNQNPDEMRFCLNCGAGLPDAPVIVNVGGSSSGQSNPGSNPFGQNVSGQQSQPPNYQQPNNYSMVPPPKKGGNKKIWIAVIGVVLLVSLIGIAGIAIVAVGLMNQPQQAKVTPTPAPVNRTTPAKSPSPASTTKSTPVATPTTPSNQFDKVKVAFKKIWVDYNKAEGNEFGMLVHVAFDVTKMKDVDSFAMITFYDEAGMPLENGTGINKTKDGRVAVFKPLKPQYDATTFTDLEIFVPYNALNLSTGLYRLTMNVELVDLDENLIRKIGQKDFEYEQK